MDIVLAIGLMDIWQVSQLSEKECEQMLIHCLAFEQRTLNSDQMTMAMTALNQCPVPLFLWLMMRQLKSWKSYSKIQDPLPTSTDGILS